MTLKEMHGKLMNLWKEERDKRGKDGYDKEKETLFSKCAFAIENLMDIKESADLMK